MGGCWAGCEFLRSRNPKKGQTASPANHSRHTAEGIKRRSTQGSPTSGSGGRWNQWLTLAPRWFSKTTEIIEFFQNKKVFSFLNWRRVLQVSNKPRDESVIQG